MATFYVGQRVRIKWSTGWPELAGEQGVITSTTRDKSWAARADATVAPDRWGTPVAPREGVHGALRFGPSFDQLEPIQPEGHKTVEWNACLWQPEHLREVA